MSLSESIDFNLDFDRDLFYLLDLCAEAPGPLIIMTTVHIHMIDCDDAARYIDFSFVSEWMVSANYCDKSEYSQAWSPKTMVVPGDVKKIDSESDPVESNPDEYLGVCTFSSSTR